MTILELDPLTLVKWHPPHIGEEPFVLEQCRSDQMLEASGPRCLDVFQPDDDASRTRLLGWVIVSRMFALMAIVWVATAASAEPPQAPGSSSDGSLAPAPAPKELEAELQKFAKLPVDKAIEIYSKTLTQMREAEDEFERRWIQNDKEFNARRESAFKKRVPPELAEAFKRMADRSARHAWVVALSKMAEGDRAAASAKDTDQRGRVWELRRKFIDEVEHEKIPELSAMTETSKRFKEQKNKVLTLWAKAGKMETSLFPRLSADDIRQVRKWPAFDGLAEETKNLRLGDTIAAALKEASAKDLDSWVSPDLEEQLAMLRDSSLRFAPQRDVNHLTGKALRAAIAKDRVSHRKFQEIWATSQEGDKYGQSLTSRADLEATPLDVQRSCQQWKAAQYRARQKKLEDVLARKSGE